MRILVVNDDGIEALGIRMLADKLRPYASEMMVVAPTFEQSAASHAVTVRKGLEFLTHEDMFPGVKTYSIDGSPADCVKFARRFLKYDFDIVFSGVNNGLNLGDDIIYSGTVAGASEAAFMHKRGIAFSSPRHDFSGFDKYFDMIMKYILSSKVYRDNLILNINIPSLAKGIMVTRQGSYPFDTRYVLRDDGRYHTEGTYENVKNDESTDVAGFYSNYISVTPLTVDRTDFRKLSDDSEKVEF